MCFRPCVCVWHKLALPPSRPPSPPSFCVKMMVWEEMRNMLFLHASAYDLSVSVRKSKVLPPSRPQSLPRNFPSPVLLFTYV